jgi:hypothetical protein
VSRKFREEAKSERNEVSFNLLPRLLESLLIALLSLNHTDLPLMIYSWATPLTAGG